MSEKKYKDTISLSQIKSLLMEGITSIYVLDAAGRIETQYDASTDAELDDPCLKTDFKYQDGALGSSRKVIATNESIVGWPGYEPVSVGAGNDFTAIP